jgi:FtsP/CotA-like multicopper oxidase with cupredoxin domain/plastocyanin
VRFKRNDESIGMGAWVFALVALLLGLSALGVAGQALTRSDDAKSIASASNGTQVTLREFAIDPSTIAVDTGGTLTVKNAGTVAHNLAVKGTDLKTPDIAPGKSESLDVSSLKAGMYTAYCQIPGHAAAGMTAMLHVGLGGATAAAAGSAETKAQNDQQDAVMKAPVDAYEKQLTDGPNTKGVGAQVMAPKVLADGTKEFDLTAAITDWEVSPGNTVQAWTYNGTVPGPTIKVDPGDHVKVVLDNQLPQSTAIHFHGITVPNAMDGVPDITQPPVKPGETFTYDFVASQNPEVGMYHSHHHAEHQVPDGLTGAFIVGTEPVPAGVAVSQEVPMVLNDAGVIGLTLNGKSFPATAPVVAKQGEWVEVQYMNEGLQIHPMHLHGLPQLVIAKDGFPTPMPYQVDTLDVAPGERYTVLVHATDLGVWAWHCHILSHAESDKGMFGMVTTFIVQ